MHGTHRLLFVCTLLILGVTVMGGHAFGASDIPDSIQLVAVQMTLDTDDFWTKDAFAAKIRQMMDATASAVDADVPALVVFPEDVGLMLVVQGMQRRLSSVDSIETAIETATKASLLKTWWTKWRNKLSWVPALFLSRHRLVAETYFTVFSEMAREYNVYLVAGTVILPPYEINDGIVAWNKKPLENKVYNTAYVFGPDGKVIGKQDKVYLIDLEKEAALDLAEGKLDDLRVIDTPLGTLGVAICLDAFQDDVVDRLVAQGADILIQPSANPMPWSEEQQIDWIRSSYDQTFTHGRFTYAVNPMLTGPLWDVAFFGQSSIVARQTDDASLGYAALEPVPGFVAVAAGDDTEEIVVRKVPHPQRTTTQP